MRARPGRPGGYLWALLALGVGDFAQADDCNTELGRGQFARCAVCHSLEAGVHMTGPSLAGVIGRVAGTVDGFFYSPAMATADITWSRETLSLFLENPAAMIPGTFMPFSGLPDPVQRTAIACYIATTGADSP